MLNQPHIPSQSVRTYVVDSSANSGKTMLDRSFVDSFPDSAAADVSQLLRGVDSHAVEVLGEIDDESAFTGGCGSRVVSAAFDREIEGVVCCVADLHHTHSAPLRCIVLVGCVPL